MSRAAQEWTDEEAVVDRHLTGKYMLFVGPPALKGHATIGT